MDTNIIEITNEVTITNLEVVTNTLSKIDIMNIPTDWNVLGVTIFGALATVISAGFMWKSVQEMRKQREQIQKQYDDELYQKDTKIMLVLGSWIEKYFNSLNITEQGILQDSTIVKQILSYI